MSKTSTPSLSLNVSGDTTSESVGPLTFSLVGSPAYHSYLTLSIGNNTVNIPQLPNPAQMVIIIPPTGSGNTKWILQSGDTTGVQIGEANWTALSIHAGLTSFLIHSTGSETIELWIV